MSSVDNHEDGQNELVAGKPLPTFMLKPNENEKFYPSKVKVVVGDVLNEILERHGDVDNKWIEEWVNFPDDFENLAKSVADGVKAKCCEILSIPRYKLIVQVTIGQKKDQGTRIASRCLWDTSTDNYVSLNFQNECIWLSILVFGLYTD